MEIIKQAEEEAHKAKELQIKLKKIQLQEKFERKQKEKL